MTDHTKSELLRQLATLRVRETAAATLVKGKTTTATKCPVKAAKLPERERRELSVLRKWEVRYKVRPSLFTQTKMNRAQERLANTQRQMAKLARNPFADELVYLRKDIRQIERMLAKIERVAAEQQKALTLVLTELYDIDSITRVITKRSTGMPIKSTTIMANGERIGLETARQLLMAGDLA